MNPARYLPLAALALLPFARPASPVWPSSGEPPAALAPERPLASLVPEQALVYVELGRLEDVLGDGLEHPFARAVLDSPLGAGLEEAWGRPAEEALADLDRLAGYEVLPRLASVGSGGVALAAGFERAKPIWLVLVRGDDAALFGETLERTLSIVAERAGYPGAFDTPASHRRGADHWTIGEDVHLARRGAFAVLSNRASAVEDALARAGDARAPLESGLLARAEFRASHGARTGEELAWAWLDAARARDLQKAVGKDKGLVKLAEAAAIPAVQLLLGPGLATLGRANSMSAALTLAGEDLELVLDGVDVDAGHAAKLLPPAGAVPEIALPAGGDNLAEAVLYRDLAGVFRERVELFAPEVQPKFAEAESNLALFFGGADITENILPALGPWVAAVSRPVRFDERATPDVPLPGLVLLARVDDAEGAGAELVAAFQTAVGLANVDRAQKSLDSLRLGLRQVEGVTLTTASFRAPRAGDGVDMRYNLAPACALVGETFVLGTHADLVEELVRELSSEQTSARATPAGESLSLSGEAVARALADNRELLVMNGVLKEGKSRVDAEGEIDGLVALASLIERLELSVSYPEMRRVRVGARADLRASGAMR